MSSEPTEKHVLVCNVPFTDDCCSIGLFR